MTAAPRVSIGLPVLNGARYLGEALEAILGQTYGDLELLISDNASTDATEEICREAAARDRRVRYRRLPRNLGAAANYNGLVAWARGELFRWAPHDDVMAPTLLERCVKALDGAPPGAVLAFPDMRLVDARGAPLPDEVTPRPWRGGAPHERLAELLLPRESYLVKCAPVMGVIRTRELRRTRLIRPHESSDAVLIVELALRGELVHVPEVLELRRVHPEASREAHLSDEQRTRWFDGAARPGFPMPRTRIALGYWDALRRAPVGAAERARCAAVIVRWAATGSRWRVIGGEVKIALRERAARTLRASPGG